MSTRIYLSSRFGRQQEMREHRILIEQVPNFRVVSRWIDASSEIPEADMSIKDRGQIAKFNWKDIELCDILLAFTEPVDTTAPFAARGGRHVEFGAALAMNKKCVVIGPLENTFHCISSVWWFDTIERFIEDNSWVILP